MSAVVEAIYSASTRTRCPLPLMASPVQAGFPSPADDYVERMLDLNEHLIKRPAATFFVTVRGNSMMDAGIHQGDMLIVDKSVEARDGDVVIAIVDGSLLCKRFRRDRKGLRLVTESSDHPPVEIHPDSQVEIWGVVQHVIHSPRRS